MLIFCLVIFFGHSNNNFLILYIMNLLIFLILTVFSLMLEDNKIECY
jgi:hypothetical protein